MKQFYLFVLFLLLAPAFAGAQAISINTDASNPDPSAILDVKSTDKGVLAPRMTTAQRTAIAAPATGLLVFDTTTGSFWYFDNGIWNQIASIAVSPPLASGANNTVIPIPDNNPTGITSIINLTQAGVIDANTQIKVCIDITHTRDADLDISLIAPDGTTIDLSSDNGSINDNYTNTCFTTALAPGVTSGFPPFTGFWTPEQPFSNFINKPIMGNWTLKVVDDGNTQVGQLNWWSIEIPSKAIAPALLSDKDSDTKVQVEKNPDEDIIRFELSGTEGMVLRKTAIGSPRLELPDGLANTFIGQGTGASNTTGYQNTANGFNALFSNTTGYQNTANGYNALFSNTTGGGNTANGINALYSNTDGSINTAIGWNALFSNTTGLFNTANGQNALYSNSTGNYNTANGSEALYFNTSGYSNTANGAGALGSNTTGNQNTANGFNALLNNTTGSNNTALGYNADVLFFPGNLTNATAIGYNAKVGASNSLVLGATGADAVSVGVGTSIPDASAVLDLTSTSKGMLAPRMTTAERAAIGSPATGLLVFDTDSGGFWFYNGVAWAEISRSYTAGPGISIVGTTISNTGVPKVLADADNDTKVQVEKSPDEDIIRFDLAGTESMVLRKNAGGSPRLELLNPTGNTFVGKNAGLVNTGFANSAFGEAALAANVGGTQNTANGYYALFSNTTGNQNAAFGNAALSGNTAGSGNAALGMQALTGNTTGNENTASGSYALFSNTTGHSNTGLGSQALFVNSTGQGNTAAGHSALFSNTTGFSNVALGRDALYNNTDRSNLVAVGDSALYNNGNGASFWYQAIRNTAIGSKALFSNTSGYENTANGVNALYSNTSGYENTANGVNALYSNITGRNNTANGASALGSNIDGILNTATGWLALSSNTTGNLNTATGERALVSNISGQSNTADGTSALYSNTTGNNNTAIGRQTLNYNTDGGANTAIGWGALLSNISGSYNTGLGAFSDVSTNNLNNATAIGRATTVNASNKVRIGNSSVTVIEGQVAYTFPSDARFKFNIHDETVPGLAFIEKLRPVTYQFDTRKFDEHLMQNMPDSIRQQRLAGQDYRESTAIVQTGFLAQEVEQACKDLRFEFSGLHVPTSAVDNYGIAYGSFVPLLVKGMQEQQVVIEALKAENVAQKAENAAMKAQLDAQSAQLKQITAALQTAGIGVGN